MKKIIFALVFIVIVAGSVQAESAKYTDLEREAGFEQDAFLFSENNLKARFFGEIARSCIDANCNSYEDACVTWNKFKDVCYLPEKICSLSSCKKYKIYCELVFANQDEKRLDAAFDAYYVTADGVKNLVEKMSYNIEPGHGWPPVWTYEVDADNIGHCEHSLIPIKQINLPLPKLYNNPWPVFHGDLMHTGLSLYDTSHIDGTVKWAFEAGGGIESSPVVGTDGTIYFGAHDGYLYAINKEGKLNWKLKIGTPIGKMKGYTETGGKAENFIYDANTSIPGSPTIDKDGTIYIASRDQYLFAISPDGTEKWKFPIGVAFDSWSSPLIGSDGTVYMTSARPKGGLYAINPDGTEKWYYKIEMGSFNSPAIGLDGMIYIAFPTGYNKNALIAINQDGTKKWEIPLTFFSESTPTIAGDTIYIGTYTEELTGAGLYAISIPERKIKWHSELDTKEVMTTPAVSKDGSTIYIGTFEGIFYGINADGSIRWSLDTGKEIGSSAAIGADGTVYFGSGNGFFYAMNPNGKEKWHYDTKSSVASSPAIDSDGTIYIGAWDKKLYAIGRKGEGISVETPDIVNTMNYTQIEGKREPPKECMIDENFIGEERCRALVDKEPMAKRSTKGSPDNGPPEDCFISGKFIGREKCEALMQGVPLSPEEAPPQETSIEKSFFQKIVDWFTSLFN